MADTSAVLDALEDVLLLVTADDVGGTSITIDKVLRDGFEDALHVKETFAYMVVEPPPPIEQEMSGYSEYVQIGVTLFAQMLDGETEADDRVAFARRLQSDFIERMNSYGHMSLGGTVDHCWITEVGDVGKTTIGNVDWAATDLTLVASILQRYGA